MPWGPFRRLSLWYEVEEAKHNCHKAKQEKSIHTQKDYPTDIVLHGRTKEREAAIGIMAQIDKMECSVLGP